MFWISSGIPIALAIALVLTYQWSNDDASVRVLDSLSSPTPTLSATIPARTAATFSAAQAQDLARALAVLHPSPTPTPQVPFGFACNSDDLTAVHMSSGGAGAFRLEYIELMNSGTEGCDLPVLLSLAGFDEAGTLITQASAPVENCSSGDLFCVSSVPLPLQPLPLPSPKQTFGKGSAGIILEHSRCDSDFATCEESGHSILLIEFHFAHGLVVPAELRKPLFLYRDYISVWGVRAVP